MIAGHIRRSPEAAPIIVFDSFEKAKQLCDEELRSIADCTGGRHLLVFVSRSPTFLRFHRTFDRNKAL